MPRRLIPHETYVREAARAWVAREAEGRTGVGCPGCEGELLKLSPRQRTAAERCFVRCQCEGCGRTEWLPE